MRRDLGTASGRHLALLVSLLVLFILSPFVVPLRFGIEELQPGSFSGLAAMNPGDYITLVMQMRYFSFITLTTVGFGDIVPQSPAARTFSTLEAVVGQIYLAVLVARLVGLHIVHANRSQSSQEK